MKIKITRLILLFSLLTVCGLQDEPSKIGFARSTPQQQPTETFLPLISRPSIPEWPMLGANPERTSWTAEEVAGKLDPEWYKPFEPYIPYRVQIIAALGNLYISTAKGLYALNASSGAEVWVYPTERPLGHSPTIYDTVAYVGGMDHKLHAINALTGQGLWTFEAGAGFDTNPLVVNGKVFAGNRDGKFYAVHTEGPNIGELAWSFPTGGPIHLSAAYKDGVVYFASNDSYAYALNASTGQLVWKSAKLPAGGFHSWWPVIYQDEVIFVSSHNYSTGSYFGANGGVLEQDSSGVFPNYQTDPRGLLVGPISQTPGPWVPGTPTIDTSKSENGSTIPITEYFESYPWRRTYFVLDRLTGEEYSTDFDNDGDPEYPPILWSGTHTGNRYPPIVGGDGVLYQANTYMSDPYILGGQVSGWQPGTPLISVISTDWGAHDEPHVYSAGGDLIYWALCCDRQAGSIDISVPNSTFYERYTAGILPPTSGGANPNEVLYFNYNLEDLVPGYKEAYQGPGDFFHRTFGGKNGIYSRHGDQNPPIPYMGRVYLHRGNSVIAFAPVDDPVVALPPAATVSVTDPSPGISPSQLSDRLVDEIEAILDAGHLRPGFASTGIYDIKAIFTCGDALNDYFHHPGDVIVTLLRALPHLPSGLQQQVLTYLQNEFNAYPPYEFNHIGWNSGSSREAFDLPPEIVANLANHPTDGAINGFDGWTFAPHSLYALWKYAEQFGDAQSIYNQSASKLPDVPPVSVLTEMPHVHNAFIAGYYGFLQLEALAGEPPSQDVQQDLDYLINLRLSSFDKDAPDLYFPGGDPGKFNCRTLNISRNFMYLTPELSAMMRSNPSTLAKVQEAVNEYTAIAPYWFASRAEFAFSEGTFNPLQDYHSLFLAKAWILQDSYDHLVKFLDVPAFPRGDLYYIDKLILLIESGGG